MIDYRCLVILIIGLTAGACAQQPQPIRILPTASATLQSSATPSLTAVVTPSPPIVTPTLAATSTPPPTSLPTALPAPTIAPTLTVAPTPTATQVAPTALPSPVAQPDSAFQYTFPVRGESISYGRAHHDYPATDIFCPIGSLFVAPTNGVIDYVSREDIWDPKTDRPADRGGISIAMIGDDGVRYYGSHLSQINEEISPGLCVQVGQQLGLTGKSGNARFTPSHVHFGISHPTTPDDWRVRRGEISPYPYLKAWERDQQLMPELP